MYTEVFYCECPQCESRMVLPITSPLGTYPSKAYAPRNSEYICAKNQWPLKFLCVKCRTFSDHLKPKFRSEEPGNFEHDIRGKFIQPIQIKRLGLYEDETEIIYAVDTRTFSHRELADVIGSAAPRLKSLDDFGNPNPIRDEDELLQAPFDYDF
jgi:hypothetical protein